MRHGPVDFAIVTALKVERNAVLRLLPHVETLQDEGDPHTYYYAQLDTPGTGLYSLVVTMLLKPGNYSAAASTTRLIQRWQPRFVFVVGIAGGVAGRVALGDVVVADYCYAYEPSKRRQGGDESRPQQFPTDQLLYGRAQAYEDGQWQGAIAVARPASSHNAGPAVHFGPIASGEKVIADLGTLPQLIERVPKLLATEMEGAGVANALHQAGHAPGFFEIRGISDFADDQKNDDWHTYAAGAAAAFTVGFLRTGPVKPGTAEAEPAEQPPESHGSIGLLRHVAAGPFMMGSSYHVREAPPRTVYLPDFEMGNVPVTISQYAAFVDSGGYQRERWWSEAGWAWRRGNADRWGRAEASQPDDWANQSARPSYPVTGVTWFEAEAYCNWLGTQKNRNVRLPTEEEWEKAARGTDGRLWPWGDAFNPKWANTYEYGALDTLPVEHIAEDVSPFGLRDMGGNVQQWTASPYRPLPDEAFPDRTLRVARGGSWNDTAFGARASFRHVYPPGYFFPFLGFRIVMERL